MAFFILLQTGKTTVLFLLLPAVIEGLEELSGSEASHESAGSSWSPAAAQEPTEDYWRGCLLSCSNGHPMGRWYHLSFPGWLKWCCGKWWSLCFDRYCLAWEISSCAYWLLLKKSSGKSGLMRSDQKEYHTTCSDCHPPVSGGQVSPGGVALKKGYKPKISSSGASTLSQSQLLPVTFFWCWNGRDSIESHNLYSLNCVIAVQDKTHPIDILQVLIGVDASSLVPCAVDGAKLQRFIRTATWDHAQAALSPDAPSDLLPPRWGDSLFLSQTLFSKLLYTCCWFSSANYMDSLAAKDFWR